MKKHEIAKLFRKYLLAPPRCMFCGSERCTQEIPLCKTCFGKYVSAALDGCDDCGALPINCHCFAVKNCAAHYWLFNYNKAEIKDMVNALKRSRDIHAFTFLAARLADAIYITTNKAPPYDCVCYVPRNPKTKRLYNHDHAEELAIQLARFLKLPCLPLLNHTGVKGEQKQLAREFRGDAAKLRFEMNETMLVNGKLPYKAPLLVDDMVTTGSTAYECARILKLNGAKLVGLAFIAHTPQHKRKSKAGF